MGGPDPLDPPPGSTTGRETIAPCKVIQDSLRFWIPIVSEIFGFFELHLQDSGFHKYHRLARSRITQKFAEFRNPD